jgi:hypothetical protein
MHERAELERHLRQAIAMFSNGIPESERRCGWHEGGRLAFQKLFERMLEDLVAERSLGTAENRGILRGLDTLGISRGAWYDQTILVVQLSVKFR